MKRPLTFVDGVAVGFGAIGLLVVLSLAAKSSTFEAMYKEMGNAQLSPLTKLMFSPLWWAGAPLVLVAASVVALVMRPHRYLTLGVAAATFVIAGIWLYGLYAPIFALAGNIQG